MFEHEGRAASGVAVRRGSAVASRTFARGIAALFFLAFMFVTAQAQTPIDGAIRGVTVDQVAAVIAGAVVHVDDPSRALNFSVLCDPKGYFLLAHLPAGAYRLTISAPGFATLSLDHVNVEVGGTSEVTLRLKPAGVQSMVTV